MDPASEATLDGARRDMVHASAVVDREGEHGADAAPRVARLTSSLIRGGRRRGAKDLTTRRNQLGGVANPVPVHAAIPRGHPCVALIAVAIYSALIEFYYHKLCGYSAWDSQDQDTVP